MIFIERCYGCVKKIPRGRVTTYGEVARVLGINGASRAVGNAMKKSPGMPEVPCHRVVCSNGKIGGFNNGVEKKIKMLEKEGVEIINGKIDLGKYFYSFK